MASRKKTKGGTPPDAWPRRKRNGVLMLGDGTLIEGFGLGATGEATGELCFNTAMTGYQEILTDPSYAGQIVTFTFPHIGNIGANEEDIESIGPVRGVRGAVLRADITRPSNYRATAHFNDWLKERGIIAICGVDTRGLTARIREHGFIDATIAHNEDGRFDHAALKGSLKRWPGLLGADLAQDVTGTRRSEWRQTPWRWNRGFGEISESRFHVVAMDFGLKPNILRLLAQAGCALTVVPASTPAADILALRPHGVFLSNGPGDPAATAKYAAPQIRALVEAGIPLFGICLGHQMLALALGAKTVKMHQGHHGANHPVKDHTTGKVEITSMNHGFAVDAKSLPAGITETHVSLFDGSNCGLAVDGKPVFSVQHHPEASPGPQDSHYLFTRFAEMMEAARKAA